MKLLLQAQTAKRLEYLQADPKGSHLWYGPASIGKYTAALELAQRLNCPTGGGDECVVCRQVQAGNYPDVITVQPEDKISIGIGQIRALDGELGLRPYRTASHRFIIIDSADKLTLEAQNALLKAIEEPPPATTFVLLAADRLALLPTVRSRCLELSFAPIPVLALAKALHEELALSAEKAQHLAELAEGLPGRALALAHDQAALAAWEAQEAQAAAVIAMSLFDRFVLVRQLHDAKADLVAFGQRVVAHLRQEVRRGRVASATEALSAADRYLERLHGGVTARTALEGLMLEQ